MSAAFWTLDLAGLGPDAPAVEYDELIRRALYGFQSGRPASEIASDIVHILVSDWGLSLDDQDIPGLALAFQQAWLRAESDTAS